MSGVRIEIDFPAGQIRSALDPFVDLDPAMVLDPVGALIATQTERRLDKEKTAPDGTAWQPNREGSPTLVREGALMTTIDYEVDGDQVSVGSGQIYAAIHHFGGTIVPRKAAKLVFVSGGKTFGAKSVTIPARPWLGVSAANLSDIEAQIARTLARFVQ